MVKAKKVPKQANPLAVRRRKGGSILTANETDEKKKKKKRFRKGKRVRKPRAEDNEVMQE